MRSIARSAVLAAVISAIGGLAATAQSNDSRLAFGSKFTYRAGDSCSVESGNGLTGQPIFRIEVKSVDGKIRTPKLSDEKRERLVALLGRLKSTSFSLPYTEPVLHFDGEEVEIELSAMSFNLTYCDDFRRAKKSKVIREIVQILKVLLEPHHP